MWVHVGQRAIVSSHGIPKGHQLRFRASHPCAGGSGAQLATVLAATFADVGIPDLVGDQLAFVNLPRELLVGGPGLPFPAGQVVLELLDLDPDEALVEGVRSLVDRGYVLAVDEATAARSPEVLLPLARYVLIDLQAVQDLPAAVERLTRQRQRPVALDVRTSLELRACQALGIALFQGPLFSDAQAIGQASPTAYNLACLRIVAMLALPDVDTREVVRAVSVDAAVTAKVMQSANSASIGLARRLNSVHEAVVFVGRVTLQAWAAVMAFGDLRGEVALADALTRGRMAQLLAPQQGVDPAACFLTGLLSALAAPLGMTTQELLAQVPVGPDVSDALLSSTGPVAPVLHAVLAYEHATLDDAADPSPEQARQAYLEALRWSTRTVQAARS